METSSSSIVKQTLLTVAASLAFLSIGLVRGYSSSALPSIKEKNPEILPTVESLSWAGSIPPVGALIGSLVSGPMMQTLGRRQAVLIAAPLWALSWTVLANATKYFVLLIGRFCTGFCVGLVLPATQVYVSECCSPRIRGRLGSLPSLFMSLGILISYILGYWMDWQMLAWSCAVAACLIFVSVFPLPESPIWFSIHEQYRNAEKSLNWLKLPETHESIQLSKKCACSNPELTKEDVAREKSLFNPEVLFSRGVLKPLGVGLGLLAFQQISGIDAVIFYTVDIFKSSGSTLDNHFATIIVGLVQLVSNIVSLFIVDKAGRKPLLITSGIITSIAMSTMGISYSIDSTQNSLLGFLPLASLIFFMIGYSLGFGCIPFLLLGELFATKHRGSLSAIAGSWNLFVMFVVIKTYHKLTEILTPAGTFFMYSGFCALSVLFVIFLVPETKGKTLQEIEQHFRSAKPPPIPREVPDAEVALKTSTQ